jgi:hypothetical protein
MHDDLENGYIKCTLKVKIGKPNNLNILGARKQKGIERIAKLD